MVKLIYFRSYLNINKTYDLRLLRYEYIIIYNCYSKSLPVVGRRCRVNRGGIVVVKGFVWRPLNRCFVVTYFYRRVGIGFDQVVNNPVHLVPSLEVRDTVLLNAAPPPALLQQSWYVYWPRLYDRGLNHIIYAVTTVYKC